MRRPGSTSEKGIIAWFASNHVAANLLMLFIIVAGLISAFTILNLFIGIIVSTMQATHWEEEEAKRLAAIASLGRLGGERAANALDAILDRKDEADEVRAAAFKALRRLQRRAERELRLEEVSQ